MSMEQDSKLNIPTHVAIIMDGNGRWAKRYGLSRSMGHKKGAQNLLKIVLYANKLKIKYLTVFAFSTENWNRPKEEVDYLMKLPIEFFNEFEQRFRNENIKIKVIGSRNDLPQELVDKIEYVEEVTKDKTGLTFIIAFNYGSQLEIVEATKNIYQDIINKKLQIEGLTPQIFEQYLFTKDIPSVDLLIRTSGELRISNFLLWQIAYSELYFTKTLWPDFSTRHFDKAIKEYSKRNRRFGAI